jgi:excisionase family DNA binding protein
MKRNPIVTNAVPKEPLPIVRMAYSVDEAAVATGLSRSSLYLAMKAGELAFVHYGARRLLPLTELEIFIARLGGAAK